MDKGGGNATLASEDDPLVLHATNIDDDNQVQASFARRSAFSQVRIHTFVCYIPTFITNTYFQPPMVQIQRI